MALFEVAHPERAQSAQSKDVRHRSSPYDDTCPASGPARTTTAEGCFGLKASVRTTTKIPGDVDDVVERGHDADISPASIKPAPALWQRPGKARRCESTNLISSWHAFSRAPAAI